MVAATVNGGWADCWVLNGNNKEMATAEEKLRQLGITAVLIESSASAEERRRGARARELWLGCERKGLGKGRARPGYGGLGFDGCTGTGREGGREVMGGLGMKRQRNGFGE
ncbi:hypothetical protein M0R45_019229 [Rubus argutus]|uniref:Uncharacterized protein n=1 Tax=Rubus argutus TaxID=59490 RepID=A0AAW1X779_RUBAR